MKKNRKYALGFVVAVVSATMNLLAEDFKETEARAKSGNVEAMYELGLRYDGGDGVERNVPEAVKWYRKAAENGNIKAMRSLGYSYVMGIGVAKDVAEGTKWFNLANEKEKSRDAATMTNTEQDKNEGRDGEVTFCGVVFGEDIGKKGTDVEFDDESHKEGEEATSDFSAVYAPIRPFRHFKKGVLYGTALTRKVYCVGFTYEMVEDQEKMRDEEYQSVLLALRRKYGHEEKTGPRCLVFTKGELEVGLKRGYPFGHKHEKLTLVARHKGFVRRAEEESETFKQKKIQDRMNKDEFENLGVDAL